MFEESDFCFAQGDGGPPTTVALGNEPGESAVFVDRARFQGGTRIETPGNSAVNAALGTLFG
jgi:hypothetical protein